MPADTENKETFISELVEMFADKNVEEIKDILKIKDGHTPSPEELLALIRPLIPSVPTADDIIPRVVAKIPPPKHGETPSDDKLRSLIKPLIPPPVDGKTPSRAELKLLINSLLPPPPKDGSPDKPLEIAEKLNTLEEAVDQSVIKGLVKTLRSFQDQIDRLHDSLRSSFSGMLSSVKVANLSSQANGTLKTFSTPAHSVALLLVMPDFPTVATEGAGFSSTGWSITTTDTHAPPSGTRLLFLYVE